MWTHYTFPIPQHLIETMSAEFGEGGVEWSRNLPHLLHEVSEILHVSLQPPFPALSYHYVAPGIRSDGVEVVLKIGVPGRELEMEMAALRLWAGKGSVALLEAIPEKGIFVLERLRPGTSLATLEDEELAVAVATDVMRQLRHRPPEEHSFPSVLDWGSIQDRAARSSRARPEYQRGHSGCAKG